MHVFGTGDAIYLLQKACQGKLAFSACVSDDSYQPAHQGILRPSVK